MKYQDMFCMVDFVSDQTMVFCIHVRDRSKTWVGVEFAARCPAWEPLLYKFKDPVQGFEKIPKVGPSQDNLDNLDQALKTLLNKLKDFDKLRKDLDAGEGGKDDEPR